MKRSFLTAVPVATVAAALIALTGCQAWNRTYDPAPLSSLPAMEGGVGVDGGDCDACSSQPIWKRYTIWGRMRHAATCGSGCGEWYFGEWLYDPPPAKGCDKCDMDGNYIGPQDCPDGECRGIFHHLHGRRNGSGCPSCGVAGEHDCAAPAFDDALEGTIIDESVVPIPQVPPPN